MKALALKINKLSCKFLISPCNFRYSQKTALNQGKLHNFLAVKVTDGVNNSEKITISPYAHYKHYSSGILLARLCVIMSQ